MYDHTAGRCYGFIKFAKNREATPSASRIDLKHLATASHALPLSSGQK